MAHFFGGQAVFGHVEDEFLVAGGLVLGSQRSARFFEVREARIVGCIASPRHGNAGSAVAIRYEAFEGLADTTLEAGCLCACLHGGIERLRKLALVGDMRNEARRLRLGLAELDVHGNSRKTV